MTSAFEDPASAHTIVVVGAGPRGAAIVERFAAASHLVERDEPVTVWLVDPHVCTGGAVWRSDQTRALYMNTTTCQTTLFPDVSTAPRLGPGIGDAPRLDEFLAPAGYAPTDFAPRAEHGRYIAHVIEQARILAHPRTMQIVPLEGTVVDVLHREECGTERVIVDVPGQEQREIEAACVIFALGHLRTAPSPRLAALADFAAAHGLPCAMPNNPLDVDYSQFDGATSIAIEGMGLNFYDAIGVLTERWGGIFTEDDGQLVYAPSGREAHLVVGSRSGQLYRAKPDVGAQMPTEYEPRVMTDRWLHEVSAQVGGVSFEREVMPRLRDELKVALEEAGFHDAATDAALDELLFPLGRRPEHAENAHERTLAALRRTVRDSSAPADPVWVLVYRVLSAARTQVNWLVDHGALASDSFVREWLGYGQNSFAAWRSGPPLFRSRQLLALANAGLVTFVGPGMSVRGDGTLGRFVVKGGGHSPTYEADAFLAAHLPSVDIGAFTSPLIRALRKRGEIRPARLRAHGIEEGAVTGSIDVTDDFMSVRVDGREDSTRLFLGVPVTTSQPGSAITAEPGTASPLLINAERAVMRALGLR